MKATSTHNYSLIKPSSIIAGLAIASLTMPLMAIERPADVDAGTPKEKAEEEKAMIGLGGAPASETLALQLGLDKGNGLTLFHVIPGSPADKAGLKRHDVITSFEGKPIGSQQDLSDAIETKKPGDEVTVNYIHEGKATEKKVTLAVRPKHMNNGRQPGADHRWLFKGLGGDLPEADLKLVEEQMKKHKERLEKQLKKNGKKLFEFKFEDLHEAVPGQQGIDIIPGFNMKASSSISMADNEGSVTMKTVDGKKEVIVKDKKGDVVYEGPYDTAQDKAAVPDDISNRLKKLNIGENGNMFQLKIGPGGMIAPPVPDEDEDEDA